jgi:hypothetical protein
MKADPQHVSTKFTFHSSSVSCCLPSASCFIRLDLWHLIPGFIFCNHAFVYVGCPMILVIAFTSIRSLFLIIYHHFSPSPPRSHLASQYVCLSICPSVGLQQHHHLFLIGCCCCCCDGRRLFPFLLCVSVGGSLLLVVLGKHHNVSIITVIVIVSSGRSH